MPSKIGGFVLFVSGLALAGWAVPQVPAGEVGAFPALGVGVLLTVVGVRMMFRRGGNNTVAAENTQDDQ